MPDCQDPAGSFAVSVENTDILLACRSLDDPDDIMTDRQPGLRGLYDVCILDSIDAECTHSIQTIDINAID